MRIRQPWFAIGFVGVLAIGGITALAGGLPGPGEGTTPTASMPSTFLPGPETEPASVASPSVSSSATAAASPDAAGSTSPTQSPGPTLDWLNVGFAVGVKDPVALGSKAKVTITAPVGPICHLQARYPNGQGATVGVATHPKPGTWVWSWTVPGSAGPGQATVSFDCTYAGLSKPGTGSFDIVATLPPPTPQPTATPTWSISGSVDSPVSANNGTLTFHGQVHGTPPPGIAPIDLRCELYVDDGVNWIAQDPSVQIVDFMLAAPIGYPTPGTHSWRVSCFPTGVVTERQATGTFVVQ